MIQILELILLLIILVRLFKPDVLAFISKRKNKRLVLDSCALIDGRILDLAAASFITYELIIPEFVVHELQLLADGVDAQKRERARFGLEVIKDLQAIGGTLQVTMEHAKVEGQMPTDDKLVSLCKDLGAQLYTTDFNLQKVAEIAGIQVLNVNDLAQKLRPVALPGERKTIKLLQKGSNAQQAVGYLEDGTMVVVEQAAKYLGKPAVVEITRTHQTVSGKMLFADLVSVRAAAKPAEPRRPAMPKFKSLKPAADLLRRPASKRLNP